MSNNLYLPKRNSIKTRNLVVQSNQLTLAKYNLNVIDKRILYLIIDRLRKRYIDNILDRDTREDLFGNMLIEFKSSELKEIDNLNRMYRRLGVFREKSVQIENENEWLTVGLVNYVKHNKANNTFEIEVSKELLPYLLNLTRSFTTYSLTVALSFTSLYTQRFYEICHMWKSKGYFFYDLDELRNILSCSEVYPAYGDFNRKILSKAQKELEESFNKGIAELYFTYEVKAMTGKKNNKVSQLSFYIHESSNTNPLNWQIHDFKYNIRLLISPYFSNDRSYIDRILEKISDVKIGNHMWEYLCAKKQYYLSKSKSNNEIAKIFRGILKDDYHII